MGWPLKAPQATFSQSMKILIVDDEPPARERLRSLLAEIGDAEVVGEAGSGTEACDMLASAPVNLALVDYAMPMMSGREFVRLAREIQPDLHVIYVTGAADMVASGEFQVQEPIVVKPYARTALLKMVRELMLSSEC